MRPTPEQKQAAKLMAKELTNDDAFMAALANEVVKVVRKRQLNRHVVELIKEQKVLFERRKRPQNEACKV